jgi:hypothetical protein
MRMSILLLFYINFISIVVLRIDHLYVFKNGGWCFDFNNLTEKEVSYIQTTNNLRSGVLIYK